MSRGGLFRLALGGALAALFVWLMLRQIDLGATGKALKNASVPWIIAGELAFATGYACRILRWMLMLKPHNPRLHWIDCAGPLIGSVAANNLLPFRAGDVVRAFWFNRQLGIDAAISVTTLFVERFLDLLALIVLMAISAFVFEINLSRAMGIGGGVLVVGTIGLCTILLAPRTLAPLLRGTIQIVARFMPRLGAALLHIVNRAITVFDEVARTGVMIKLIALSLLAWIAEGLLFCCTAMALPSIGHPVASWLAFPMGTLATLIPSTPGYVGTFDYFTARGMTLLGNDISTAAAYAILVHVSLWLPPTLLGGGYLLLVIVRKSHESKPLPQ